LGFGGGIHNFFRVSMSDSYDTSRLLSRPRVSLLTASEEATESASDLKLPPRVLEVIVFLFLPLRER
jgi:hypothetical protein